MGGHVDSEKIDFSPLHDLLNGVHIAPAGAQKLDPLAVQANLMIGPDGQRCIELYDKNRPEHSILLQDQGEGRYKTVATGAGNNKDGTTRRVYHLADGRELTTDGADLFGRPVPGDMRIQTNQKISPDGVHSLLSRSQLEDQHLITEPSSSRYLHLGRSI